MAIDRRTVLLTAAGVAAQTALGRAAVATTNARELFAAARRDGDGRYAVAMITHNGEDVRVVGLPGRGHDLAVCPISRRMVAFARRPGSFAVVLDIDRPLQTFNFETPADRHFQGHGVFARDGRLLYATENDFERGTGVIGIYDATRRFQRIAELPSHGIGPHDIALSSDGRTLVVANGGLREHPDIGRGRRVLNPDAIETSLVYVDAASGTLLEKHALPHAAGLSLRHLEIGLGDTVVIGAQEQSPSAGARRVVFTHDRQGKLREIHCGEGDPLAGYVSSVSVDASGTIAAVTSSRAGAAVLIEIGKGRLIGISRLADVSGVAPRREGGSFLLTSGTGAIVSASATQGYEALAARLTCAWDNHAVAIRAR